jgi:hypothetical protein
MPLETVNGEQGDCINLILSSLLKYCRRPQPPTSEQ